MLHRAEKVIETNIWNSPSIFVFCSVFTIGFLGVLVRVYVGVDFGRACA